MPHIYPLLLTLLLTVFGVFPSFLSWRFEKRLTCLSRTQLEITKLANDATKAQIRLIHQMKPHEIRTRIGDKGPEIRLALNTAAERVRSRYNGYSDEKRASLLKLGMMIINGFFHR